PKLTEQQHTRAAELAKSFKDFVDGERIHTTNMQALETYKQTVVAQGDKIVGWLDSLTRQQKDTIFGADTSDKILDRLRTKALQSSEQAQYLNGYLTRVIENRTAAMQDAHYALYRQRLAEKEAWFVT